MCCCVFNRRNRARVLVNISRSARRRRWRAQRIIRRNIDNCDILQNSMSFLFGTEMKWRTMCITSFSLFYFQTKQKLDVSLLSQLRHIKSMNKYIFSFYCQIREIIVASRYILFHRIFTERFCSPWWTDRGVIERRASLYVAGITEYLVIQLINTSRKISFGNRILIKPTRFDRSLIMWQGTNSKPVNEIGFIWVLINMKFASHY